MIALTLIKEEFPALFVWKVDNYYGNLTVLIALAFAVGHFIQGINRTSLVKKAMQWLSKTVFSKKENIKDFGKQGVLKGRHYDLPVSPEIAEEVDNSIKSFYSVDANNLNRAEKFDLIYTPVADKMGQRHIFVAIANFLRAMSLLSFLYFLYLGGKTVYIILSPKWNLLIPQTISLLAVLLVATLVFIKDSDYFKRLTDSIPYITFLAWFKEKNIEDCNSK